MDGCEALRHVNLLAFGMRWDTKFLKSLVPVTSE
jgi:hypothetical protein